MPDKKHFNAVLDDEQNPNMIVRRLTPTECLRLQGFPDSWLDLGDWTDGKGKKHKEADSPKYKAIGNSIALPFWQWLANRIANEYGSRGATMGSLFSGIGGFELVFSRAGIEPLFSSEIEEYCIAITKKHFGDGDEPGDLWKYLDMNTPKSYKGEHKPTAFGIDQQGGKGNASFTEDVAPTVLSESHGTPHAVAYEKEDQVRKTIAIEGNGSRDSHRGDGYIESDVMYTLNTVEKHSVAYENMKGDL